jgi:hypothetical protein
MSEVSYHVKLINKKAAIRRFFIWIIGDYLNPIEVMIACN